MNALRLLSGSICDGREQTRKKALVALVLNIALINTWNRLNVITGQVAGEWTAQYVG